MKHKYKSEPMLQYSEYILSGVIPEDESFNRLEGEVDMTIVEYISKKNDILHKYTGVTLIPLSQIDNHPYSAKSVWAFRCELKKSITKGPVLVPSNCFYCVEYNMSCHNCPMGAAGNTCITRQGDKRESTYGKTVSKIERLPAQKRKLLKQEIQELSSLAMRTLVSSVKTKREGEDNDT